MTDQPETPDVETPEAPEATDNDIENDDETPDEGTFDADKARDKIRRINSENRNLRKRAADAEAKAKEAEGTGERLTALEAENLRLRIAVKHGLPEALVKRLTGTTEEEILQDAEELMDMFGGRKPPTEQPKERLRGGGDPTKPGDVDIDKMVARVFDN